MPYEAASTSYFQERRLYELMSQLVDASPMVEADRQACRSNLLRSVRERFRKISDTVVRDTGERYRTSGGCLALSLGHRTNVEHAVVLRDIHNRILGIDHHGVQNDHEDPRPETQPAILEFIEPRVFSVIVTPADNLILNQFMAHMPPGWDMAGDPMARYVACGMEYHQIGNCPHCA